MQSLGNFSRLASGRGRNFFEFSCFTELTNRDRPVRFDHDPIEPVTKLIAPSDPVTTNEPLKRDRMNV